MMLGRMAGSKSSPRATRAVGAQRRSGTRRLRRAGLLAALSALLLVGLPQGSAGERPGIRTAEAQGKRGRRARPKKRAPKRAPKDTPPAKDKVFDFTGLDISGQLRAPQLLYFLDRANEELERASLERRSFIPEMVRSLDEEAL